MFPCQYVDWIRRRTRVLARVAVPFLIIVLSSPAFGASVTLAWDPSVSTNVSAYTVRYGTAAGQYLNSTNVGRTTTAVIPGLQEGVRYYFVVTALTSGGLESDPSNEVGFTVPLGTIPLAIAPIANQTSLEDSTTTVPFSIDIPVGSELPLNLTGSSSNPDLVPASNIVFGGAGTDRTATLTPALNRSGSATITVTLDDGLLSVSRSFEFTVAPVNDAPTLNGLTDVVVAQNAGAQTVDLSGIGSGAPDEIQTLTVTALSSNPGLIPNPGVSYTSPDPIGTLSFAPVPNATGTATITVAVTDGETQNNTISRSFNVSVAAGPTNTGASIVYVEAEAGVISAPMVVAADPTAANGQYIYSESDFQGTVSYLVNLPEAGDYRVWCRVIFPDSSRDSFFVSVDESPQEVYGTAQNIWSSDWQWTQVNSAVANPRIFTLAKGIHTFVVGGRERSTFLDALYITNDPDFVPELVPNRPPTLNAPDDITVAEDAGLQTVTLTGISSGASNEVQTLTVTVSSSNPGLIPDPEVNYLSPNSTGIVTFTPVPNGSGSATISVSVSDGQDSNNLVTQTFNVTVDPVNDVPTISNIPDQFIDLGASTPPVAFSVGDLETPASTLTVTALSSNPALAPITGILFGGEDSSRSIAVTPVPGQTGTATITVSVTDAAGDLSSASFTLVVAAPPTLLLTSPANGAKFIAPATINLVADVVANDSTITKVQFYNGPSLLGEDFSAPYTFTWTNTVAGNYTVTARALYGLDHTVDSAPVGFVVLGLPLPWQTTDVGAVDVAGSAFESGGLYTVNGAGNISGVADSYRFVHQTLSGDGEITVRLSSVGNTGPEARVGVMIRENLSSGSKYAFIGILPDGRFGWQRRRATSGITRYRTSYSGAPPDAWVRLVRNGNTFNGYQSTDGITWTLVGSVSGLTMATSVHIGMAVASGDSGTLNTSTFAEMMVVP
jgi:hypothetical protein